MYSQKGILQRGIGLEGIILFKGKNAKKKKVQSKSTRKFMKEGIIICRETVHKGINMSRGMILVRGNIQEEILCPRENLSRGKILGRKIFKGTS